MPYEEEILKELKKISKIMTLSNGDKLENEIEKYATSNDRKKIWVLLDGKRQSDDIAKITGKTRRAVDIFLKTLEDANLVERPYNKPPTRIMDYIPAKWIEMTMQTETKSEQTETPVESLTQETGQKLEGVSNG